MTGLLGDSKDLRSALGGEPAFPGLESAKWTDREMDPNIVTAWEPTGGLSKRELFAAMAMQGFLANTDTMLRADMVAEHSVGYATALLKELERAALPEEKV
jgi:hypothetical protein